jgi:glycosyltransferase involved in cell wall biosynthesis
MSARPVSICMIAPNAYAALAQADLTHVGGIERDISIEARELALRGHTVSVVTWRHDPNHEAEVGGVRLLPLCGRDEGIPGLRFAHPRWTSLLRCLERADADIYYTRSADAILGQLVLWCRRKRRCSVYSVANDQDCLRRPAHPEPWRHRVLYRYGLVRADRVIVQTQRQSELLRSEFDRESQHIDPATEGPSPAEYAQPTLDPSAPPRVVWIGRFSAQKRLEWLLDIAEQRPEITFDVAGDANQPTPYSDRLWERAKTLKNVRLHGRLSHARARALIRSAPLLCCSSVYEGFPNVFLEAWSFGVPVVSTIDPDGVIAREGLGAVAADREGLIGEIDQLLGSPERWQRASERCRQHHLDHHSVAENVSRLECLFRELAP